MLIDEEREAGSSSAIYISFELSYSGRRRDKHNLALLPLEIEAETNIAKRSCHLNAKGEKRT
jgi:hypothetical protein